MEAKGQPGVAPAPSPLLPSQSADPYYVFLVFLLPPCEIVGGGGGGGGGPIYSWF
jgi:hypothetical protein